MKPWPIISIVLAVVVILLLLFDNGPTIDSSVWKERISELEDEIKVVEASRKALLSDLKKDSVRGVQIQDSLKTRLNAKSKEVVRLKVQASKQREGVQPLIDSIPSLGIFVEQQDSIIQLQDSVIIIQDHRIAAYTHQLGKLQVSMTGIIANFESNLKLEQERFAASQSQLQAQEKENKKVKRQNVVLKVVAGAAIVIGGLLGASR